MRQTLIVSLFLLVCCSENDKSVPVIKINPLQGEKTSLIAIADSIFVLPLDIPDSIFFGKIERIKSYDSLFFLQDPFQSKTLTICNFSGKFMNQLNRKGNGPGEYQEIELFAVNTENQLIINERYKGFSVYTLPDLNFIRKIKDQTGYINLESINDGQFFAMSDDATKDNKFVGCVTLNKNFELSESLALDLKEISLWGSESVTVSRTWGDVYYSPPTFESFIYKIDRASATPVVRIDFGDKAVSEKAWDDPEGEEIKEEMAQQDKAMGVHDFITRNDRGAFWYFYKDIQTKHLVFFDKNNGRSKVFSDIDIDGLKSDKFYPVGIYNDYYILILYPDELEVDKDKYPDSKLIQDLSAGKESNKVMLLFFKPKLSLLE